MYSHAISLRDLGCSQSTMNEWITLNGIETLPLRMERHCSNAIDVANFIGEKDLGSFIASNGGKMLKLLNRKKTSHFKLPVHSKNIFTTDAYRVASSLSPENKVLSASMDIKNSILAAYLDNWRLKVEAIGTKNLPEQNVPTQVNPTLEVTIGAKGKLIETVVRYSSGDRSIDQAALNILRLAEPFDPPPESVLQDHEALRFAYEWRFFPNIR